MSHDFRYLQNLCQSSSQFMLHVFTTLLLSRELQEGSTQAQLGLQDGSEVQKLPVLAPAMPTLRD